MLTVKTIVETVFAKWCDALKDKVGDNVSMENSTVVNSMPYATMYFQGLPTDSADLEGNEGAVTPTVQIDIYTSGQKALSKGYEIDEKSHAALIGMRFRRSYGPELIQSTDPSIKRLTSRYSRIIGFGDSL